MQKKKNKINNTKEFSSLETVMQLLFPTFLLKQ